MLPLLLLLSPSCFFFPFHNQPYFLRKVSRLMNGCACLGLFEDGKVSMAFFETFRNISLIGFFTVRDR